MLAPPTSLQGWTARSGATLLLGFSPRDGVVRPPNGRDAAGIASQLGALRPDGTSTGLIGFHVDDSEATLNVCLGKQFSGAELYFRGIRCENHVNSETQNEVL